MTKDPCQFGWTKNEEGANEPVPTLELIAPDQLLKIIACNCNEDGCDTARCSCRSAGMSCIAACGKCTVTNCKNCDSAEK